MSDNSLAIISKIVRLRTLALSSNTHEAAAAAGVANKLILKYQIQESELDQEATPSIIFDDPDPVYTSGRVTQWKLELLNLLTDHYGCALWNDKTPEEDSSRASSRYRLIGRETDIQIVKLMFSWFTSEIIKLCDLECRSLGSNYRHSYCKGAIKAIKDLLEYTRKNIIKEASSHSVELIENRQKMAIDYLFKKHGVIQPLPKPGINQQAFNRGYDVGSRVAKTSSKIKENT
jgi:hypothetical protein